MTDVSINTNSTEQGKETVIVQDKMKLRELELQTNYELKYLSNNFKDLKLYVETKLDNESIRFDLINKKVNWLMYIVLAQLAGINADNLVPVLKGMLIP